MKKIVSSIIVIAVLLLISPLLRAAEFESFDSPVPAEIISEKAFIRADHDNASKRMVTLEEGDYLLLIGDWDGGDAFPWYAVMIEEEIGWIYGQNLQRLDGKPAVRTSAPAQSAAAPTVQEHDEASMPETGVVTNEGDYVTVIAQGQGTDRTKAMEQAWIEAVRLAVGTVISSTSELNNDDFAESTIAHSRGVVESFDIVGEQSDDRRVTIAIQARVRKQTLIEVARDYSEAQTVKADTGEMVKILLDDKAQESSTQLEKQTGEELLKEVLDSYPAEIFYSATLDPKIYLDEDRKPYINIVQKFNEDLFWKEFLPRLHTALDGVAVKKEKRQYESVVRQTHRQLETERHAEMVGIYSDMSFRDKYDTEMFCNTIAPYSWADKKEGSIFPTGGFVTFGGYFLKDNTFNIVVPENNAEYTVYYLPGEVVFNYSPIAEPSLLPSEVVFNYYPIIENNKVHTFLYDFDFSKSKNETFYSLFVDYVRKASLPLEFSVIYLDSEGYEICEQMIEMGSVLSAIYRSFYCNSNFIAPIRSVFAFSPGFVNIEQVSYSEPLFDFFLDTTNVPWKYPIVLKETDLLKVDSMTFEYVFKSW